MARRYLSSAQTALALALLSIACSAGDPTGPPEPTPTTVTLSEVSVDFTAVGDTLQLLAVVRDQSGGVMSSQPVAWTSTAPELVSVSASGLVSAMANGASAVRASAGAATAAITVTVAQVPRAITLNVAPNATAQNRVVFDTQPAVQLRDSRGNVIGQAGITITASLTLGAGMSLDGSLSTATNTSGVATFSDLSLRGTIGTATLTFSATGATSVDAGVRLIPGSAIAVSALDTASQNGRAGQAAPNMPSVRLIDLDGNSVAGAEVIFARVSGGLGTSDTVTTDINGESRVGSWVLNATAGPNTLIATVTLPGISGNPVSFSAYGFPSFTTVPATGAQSSFATGVTFNRTRGKLTLVKPDWGLGELSPDGGDWTRVGTTAPGAGRVYASVHEARQQVVTLSDQGASAVWDFQSSAWTTGLAGDPPSPRQFPGIVYDSVSGRVLVYGGIVTGESSNPVAAVYSWDGDRWTRLADSPAGARAGHKMVQDPLTGDIFIQGGVDLGNPFGGRPVLDTWVLRANGAWENLNIQLPSPVATPCMAYEESRRTVVLMGGTLVGSGGYGLSDAVWELVDGAWRRSPVSTPVGVRVLCSAVYSPSRATIILYGSEHAGWNDVWSYP